MQNTKITTSVTALRQKPKDQEGSCGPNSSRQGTALSHSRLLKANSPLHSHLHNKTCLASGEKKSRMHLHHGTREKIKRQDMVSIFQIVCRLSICGTFHSKINCVLKRVWNSRAFMLPSFEMASECKISSLSLLE